MVISKDGKRKRKYNTNNLLNQTPELPKRTKVQAQRKFAQGQSIPSSSFQFSSIPAPSQPTTPNKDVAQSKPQQQSSELLPNKRPNTEDFLTFLCFRGTPILPPHLDYFNTANRSSSNNEATTSSQNISMPIENGTITQTHSIDRPTTTTTTTSAVLATNSNKNLSSDIPNTITTPDVVATIETKKDTPPNFIPFGVRKRAEQIPDRRHHEKVQALRKKYHEQRMAKLRAKRFTKNRSNIQTRSNILANTCNVKEEDEVVEKKEVLESPVKVTTKKSKEIKTNVIETPNVKKKLGLRSGGEVMNPIVDLEKSLKPVKVGLKPIIPPVSCIEKFEEINLNLKTEKSKFDEVANVIETTRTRGAVKKTKPVAKKAAPIRFTRQTKPTEIVVEEKITERIVKVPIKNESEFSSDDDEPLLNAITKKIKEPKQNPKEVKRTRGRKPGVKSVAAVSTPTVEKINTTNESLIDTPNRTQPVLEDKPKKRDKRVKIEDSIISKSDDDSLNKHEDSKIPQNDKSTTRKYTKRKYKKQKIGSEFDKPIDSFNQTDDSDNRHSRPSRKTKEAATIYMELIGRKLNQDEADIDDEDESNDSYPELPNVRKTEKMEIELKANFNKDKTKSDTPPLKKLLKIKSNLQKKQSVNAKNEIIIINSNQTPQTDSEEEEISQTKTKKQLTMEENIRKKEALVKKLITSDLQKLEKSFSDSDEEPLASKIPPKKKKSPDKNKSPKVSPEKNQEIQITKSSEIFSQSFADKVSMIPIQEKQVLKTKIEIPIESDVMKNNASPISPIRPLSTNVTPEKKLDTPKVKFENSNLLSPFTRTHFLNDLKDEPNSTKVNRSSDFNSKSDISPTKLSKSLENDNDIMKKLREVEELAILKSENSAKQMKLTTSSTMRELMNPLPSMEESGKIFGIASVSLAQSSGPLDTKCTLGKCGSVHKPPLGPVVPTEALLGENLSSKERRRAKVNMTHEQIQKWLIDSCVTPDPDDLPYDSIDDEIDIKVSPKPINYLTTPSPFKDEPSTSYKPTKPKQTKVQVKKEKSLAAQSKGPTLKAKPVIVKDEIKKEKIEEDVKPQRSSERITPQSVDRKTSLNLDRKTPLNNERKTAINSRITKTSTELNVKEVTTSTVLDTSSKIKDEINDSPKSLTKVNEGTTISNNTPVCNTKNSKAETKLQTQTTTKQTIDETKPISVPVKEIIEPITKGKITQKAKETNTLKAKSKETVSINTKETAKQKEPIAKKSVTDRKPIFNQRRTPVYNTKLPDTNNKKKSVINTFGAFSPENETSVYSFDKEEEVMPIAKPFRRHSRRDSNNSKSEDVPSEKVAVSKDVNKKESSIVTTTSASTITSTAVSSTLTNVTSTTLTTSTTTTTSITSSTEASSSLKVANKESSSTPLKSVTQQPEVSLTLSPDDNAKSASIAVQVSLDEIPSSNRDKIAATTTTDKSNDNDSDSEGHTFYIPLQGANITGGKCDQIIQGVAVKLGTEGPEGPNQRVIMHAKLVTKTQMGSTTTPLPESMGNVQEIVKTLIAKEASGSKSVPVGTVQPRFKSSDSVNNEQQGTSTTPQQSTSQLTRVNSNSSIFSQKTFKYKVKNETPVQMANNTTFPHRDDPAQMVEAPIFRPSEKDFQDPMEYIERISATASRFGLCKIIPPASFKPDCQLTDDIRFIAYNQYIHKMLNRWGPSTKELSAIRKYLLTQNIQMVHPPLIGGMEVDLPRLYHTVQELGGLKEVIEKKKWSRVAEEMCIPKTAHDRVTKLDDIYCKYLLPYDTLSPAERQKLFDEVEADWAKREARARRNADRCVHNTSSADSNVASDDDESDDCEDSEGDTMECQFKGRSMPLSAFYRVARNTMSVWFKNTEPDTSEIEAEFWRHVAVRDSHICVHAGSIDSSSYGYGFPTPGPKSKSSPCAKHPWNLKVLTNHSGSVLRSLGPVMGVTVPTLQFGMLFTACCWYRDPHGLPWLEYLHTGSSKIWYGVPDDQSSNFRAALSALVPTHCQNKTIWLPSDTAMVPPHMLTDRNVSLSRTEQMPGEFVVVFSRAYTSSVCTGYVVSESVYFATNTWLENAKQDFKDIQESCEPAVFSMEQLLFAISSDTRSNLETLVQILPMLTEVYEKEVNARQKLKGAGLSKEEKLVSPKNRRVQNEENECDTCRANLYISMVKTDDESIYCIQHAIKYLNTNQLDSNNCKLVYTYSIDEIEQMLEGLKERINQQRHKLNNKKIQGKNQAGKHSGGGTSTGK